MARSVRPIRLLRRSVGFAVKGVKRGVGGAVWLAWPKRRSRRGIGAVGSGSGEGSGETAALPRRRRKSDRQMFPNSLCQQGGSGPKKCQALMTVGSRMWGTWWDGRGLLNVKIYDFAIYADKKQARNSRLSTSVRQSGVAALKPSFYQDLRSSSDIDMSLVVRATRKLPIRIMAGEYKRILKRRLQKVGGTSKDPALADLLALFEEEKLPDTVREGGHVKKGSVLTFRRLQRGILSAEAAGQDLGSVRSDDLCAALFDLYLGSNPVSRSAQTLAGKKVVEFMLEDGRKEIGVPMIITKHERRNEKTNCQNLHCAVA